ncbi:hypothetical protein [Terasakiella sp. SH-1]|uniref:hypothetical protein n=1 Tax=Terasakiella sp. SH-1 TaxID=2560057 RepID=UPI00107493C1|nr:hypothetical protein [Terasakiella sp. SH-1]
MNQFQRIISILEDSVDGERFGGHGPFWRNLSRDEFVKKSVMGQKLVEPGNASKSNLVKAIKGIAPFGVNIGTSGAYFNRMPSGGRPAISEDDIAFIEQWINAGCPLEAGEAFGALASATGEQNAFWREFDDWAMFEATPEVTEHINAFMEVAPIWLGQASGSIPAGVWDARIQEPAIQSAVQFLYTKQLETLNKYFSAPIDLEKLLVSFAAFGNDTLPDDPLRPQDPRHTMNGQSMWFFWAAFIDAAQKLGHDSDDLYSLACGVLVGLLNDGLVRGRYTVNGFDPVSANLDEEIKAYARSLLPSGFSDEFAQRFKDAFATV